MKGVLLVILSIALLSCKTEKKKAAENPEQKKIELALSNKDKAVALIKSIQTGDPMGVSHINADKYKQHNLAISDGLTGYNKAILKAPRKGFKSNIIRAFEDKNYVFIHTASDFFGPKIGFDIFRFENGLIVEHWDNLAKVTPPNPSGHTQIDGPTKSTDLNKTDVNKAFVKDFISTILIKGEMKKVSNYIEYGVENYTQHNSLISDGLSGYAKAFEEMLKQGILIKYSSTHLVLGEGNFVLAISEGTYNGKATSFYDLFRIEKGKIVEHWDVIEPILPILDRKNTNEKFNFPSGH